MMQASGELGRDFSSTLTDLDLRSAEEFRQQQQIAVVVVMFTDIEGSTNLLEAKGEIEYSKLRRRHDELVRLSVEQEGAGRCIKQLGDGFMILFAEPSTAVERALEVHDILARESELRIRIGIDMGQVALEKVGGITRDAFGRFVNRAARINSAATGGQTLVSYNVWDSAIGWLAPQTVGWRSVGELLPKGFTHPIQLYEFYSLPKLGVLAPRATVLPPVAVRAPAPAPAPPVPVQVTSSKELGRGAMGAVYACANCGRKVSLGSKSCVFCGATLTVAPPEEVRLPVSECRIPPVCAAPLPQAARSSWRIPTLRMPVFKRTKAERPVRRRSPVKLLWIDEAPGKTAFARHVLAREGWTVEVVPRTSRAFAKMVSRKYQLIVLASNTARQGSGRLRFLKLIYKAGFRTPAVLFSNLQTSQRLESELKKLPTVRCTTSVDELSRLAKAQSNIAQTTGGRV